MVANPTLNACSKHSTISRALKEVWNGPCTKHSLSTVIESFPMFNKDGSDDMIFTRKCAFEKLNPLQCCTPFWKSTCVHYVSQSSPRDFGVARSGGTIRNHQKKYS